MIQNLSQLESVPVIMVTILMQIIILVEVIILFVVDLAILFANINACFNLANNTNQCNKLL